MMKDDGPRARIGMLAGGTVVTDGPVWLFPVGSPETKPFWEGEEHDPLHRPPVHGSVFSPPSQN